ncbi:DNA topoisomerase 1 [Acidocella aquatica]|uniref:DNA topoisomerase 1 n=1 Tax=Acidocella aquatica TaxID=1922313 RepID=A0ABQ6A3P0_9PROT|nr:type I DNA topoisomerase [Acidocella aquatica]GLR66248.1 DNA topoisomerase 1 [Acidocella aquatica]
MTDIVVVESPSKAKTINKYLGDSYKVLASFGHVRDLPPKDGSVRPDEDFAMSWEADERGNKHMGEIARALKGAKTLYLATDPDREGEAISWHVRAMLEDKNALKGVNVLRVTFNEITKSAVKTAMAHPRELDQPLIEAYMARRALDYLVGFTLSPVLWRKLPGSKSAGRVQSVSLRLICEREAEIEVFKSREYWTIEAGMVTPAGAPFPARLTHYQGKKLEQFDLGGEAKALAAKEAVKSGSFTVAQVDKKRTKRNPPPPFITSTLQQEASRKLGFSSQQTMRLAQQLYEGIDIGGETVGLITYMRTDGVQLAKEAVTAIRAQIKSDFGPDYIPVAPREYISKAKNAQEAHEAIRPTDIGLKPERVGRMLSSEQARLYELIYKRAMACQMSAAELDQTAVDMTDGKGQTLRATGSVLAFDGFLKLYHEDQDDASSDDEDSRLLPPIAKGDPLKTAKVDASQHFTQPPPRYSEASLVKKMEELGIGRPSTYASILTVLRDRNYVRLEARRFIPEDRGRLVTAFLTSFFSRYVDTGFTAALEEQLDEIAEGKMRWRDVLRAFWDDFSAAVAQTKDLKISDVIDALDADLGPHFFPPREDGTDPRSCPACGAGRIGLKLGRFGSFIGCSNYPTCQYTRKLAIDGGDNPDESLKDGMRLLGKHPETGEDITLKRGPYGLYVQQGEPDPADKKAKPKRSSLTKGMDPEALTLEDALGLLSLPRLIGLHPESGQKIEAGVGRFGPYVKMGAIFASLDRDDDVLHIGLNRAMDLIGKKQDSIRSLGDHPKDGAPVVARKGRFGPYAQWGNVVANLPRGVELGDFTLEQAVALLAEKGKVIVPKGKKGAAKKPAAKAKAKAAPAVKEAKAKAPPKAKAKPKHPAKAPAKAKPAAKPKAPAKAKA